jgi:hypothetical protein
MPTLYQTDVRLRLHSSLQRLPYNLIPQTLAYHLSGMKFAPLFITPLLFVAACGSTTTATSGAGSSANSPGSSPTALAPFTLADGFEHDVCGIGLIVKFIPPTATSSSASEAVLVGGPVSNVQDTVQDHTGDQPLPSNAAELIVGKTVSVNGKSFRVLGIDVTGTSVQLQPVC